MRVYPTDKQFIEGVRSFYRRRRMWGLLMVALGVVLAGIVLRFFLTYLGFPLSAVAEPVQEPEQAVLAYMSKMQFAAALMLGWGLGVTFFLCVMGCCVALNWLAGDRKSRLLLECWDRLHGAADDENDN